MLQPQVLVLCGGRLRGPGFVGEDVREPLSAGDRRLERGQRKLSPSQSSQGTSVGKPANNCRPWGSGGRKFVARAGDRVCAAAVTGRSPRGGRALGRVAGCTMARLG